MMEQRVVARGWRLRATSPVAGVVTFSRRKPLGGISLAFLAFVAALAALSPWIAPYDPNRIIVGEALRPPGGTFLLGTDTVGRDVLSRIVVGARVSLFVGVFTMVVAGSAGSLLGVVSAYVGGKADLFIQRVVDTVLAFPSLIMAMTIMSVLGQSFFNVLIALVLVNAPRISRTVRSVALSVKEGDHVLAARSIGASGWRIAVIHILPNCFASVIVMSTLVVGTAILVEASLSFLGMGLPPTVPSWGGMLSGFAFRYTRVAPWLVVFPGLALVLTVIAVNMLGDALRDVLDPRLKGA